MNFVVLQFPASNCDQDAVHAARVLGHSARLLWHKESSLGNADAVIVPGGFSYGDYLRCGAIARFSPIMQAVADFAAEGGLVMGICNGFQILCEAQLLPGALIRNTGLKFVCRYVNLRVENAATPFTTTARPGQVLRVVVKHNEGNYRVDPATLAALEANSQVVLRYCEADGSGRASSSPNGAHDNIAGVCNETHNVFGMMPHPENSIEAGVAGGTDGRHFFQSMIDALVERVVTA